MPYSIKVIWLDGEEEYLKEGTSGAEPAVFASKREAEDMRSLMTMGMEEEAQSINVVPAPEDRHG